MVIGWEQVEQERNDDNMGDNWPVPGECQLLRRVSLLRKTLEFAGLGVVDIGK